MCTLEFELIKNDPDLEARPGPGGTLIFLDGGQYCVIGPNFISMDESDCFGFGDTVEHALANYSLRTGK